MRRAHAIIVILALLTTPLALVAAVASCTPATYSTCAAMQHAKMRVCKCPMGLAGKCGSGGQAQLPDFALGSPLAPTVLLPFYSLNAPSATRSEWADFAPSATHGFVSPPFAPPRAESLA